ncbi:MAG: phosphoribosylamine--glycine ligase, partial [Verrucomicrobia bacterium]|nr:phosphoribosylamine--glycine ligase [Verrucomicrobiota bacterium]
TNQEYKYAFNGNVGIVAGAPLGGLVERDPGDKYGLARELIHPLLPWQREVKYHGPLQVAAIKGNGPVPVGRASPRAGSRG